jgi:ABC-type methionine transport system ATPase subunit
MPLQRPSTQGAPARFAMTQNLFVVNDLTHDRQGRSVLSNINISLPKGRPTCLIGASGSGKTSFLRLLNRLESPRSGTIHYKGKALESYPVRQLRAQVGFAFQAPVMFEGTVKENLLLAARFARGRVTDQDHELASRCLELSELKADIASRQADQLSGGQQQRVALARTLMTRPEVLLLDEPTSALDPDSGRRLIDTLGKLVEAGVTIVMATHRLEETEWLKADVVEFDEGAIVRHTQVTDQGRRYVCR